MLAGPGGRIHTHVTLQERGHQMRISALATALLSVSLCAGAAQADGPRIERMPRQFEKMRAHGDVVDRTYRAMERPMARERVSERPSRVERSAPARPSRGEERIRCADTGSDCGARVAPAPREAASRSAPVKRSEAMKRNIQAESRINCGDVDSCGTSTTRAQNRWASQTPTAGRAGEREGAARQHGRGQRESPRMSCNEGEECSMSSKAAQKFWAEQAIKAGTKSPSQIVSERATRARLLAERIDRQIAERKAQIKSQSERHED